MMLLSNLAVRWVKRSMCVAAMLVFFGPAALCAQSSTTIVPVDITQAHGGNVVVVASINGSRPLHFLFDTGAPEVITPQVAKELGLIARGSASVTGAGESVTTVQRAQVDTLAIGQEKLRAVTFLVAPLPHAITAMTERYPIDGLVGYGVLAHRVVTLDYVARTIQLADPASFHYTGVGSAIPLKGVGVPPTVAASLNGIPGDYQLDSGNAGATIVFREFARAHQLPTDPLHSVPVATGGVVGGTLKLAFVREGSLTIGPYTLQRPIIGLSSASAGAFASASQAGNIGASVLSRFTVTFDYTRHVMYLEPNANFARPSFFNGTGLSYDKSAAGDVRVLVVAAGSPAADAGLAPGDQIVELQGEPASGLGLADLTALESSQSTLHITFMHQGVLVTRTLVERDLLP